MNAEIASTVEARALPNTVVFGFVKALAAELSQGQVELPSVPDIVIKLQKTLSKTSRTKWWCAWWAPSPCSRANS
jgi:hypothetical protein